MGNMAGVCDVCSAGILDGEQFSPSIINVAANDVALVVVDADNVALQVAQVVLLLQLNVGNGFMEEKSLNTLLSVL